MENHIKMTDSELTLQDKIRVTIFELFKESKKNNLGISIATLVDRVMIGVNTGLNIGIWHHENGKFDIENKTI